MRPRKHCAEEADWLDAPSLNLVSQQMLSLFDNNNKIEMPVLVETLEIDAKVTQQLIRFAGSPHYDGSRRCSNLSQAVDMMGTRSMLTIGTGFSLFSCMRGSHAMWIEEWCWSRMLLNAVGGQYLAAKTQIWPSDNAFLWGLTQDFGLQLLLQQRPQPYLRILEEHLRWAEPFEDIEWRFVGRTHAIVSETLLRAWCVPAGTAALIGQHHDPTVLTNPAPARLRLAIVAESISDFVLSPGNATYRAMASKLACWLGEEVSDLMPVVDAVLRRSRDLADILQFRFAEGRRGELLVLDTLAQEATG